LQKKIGAPHLRHMRALNFIKKALPLKRFVQRVSGGKQSLRS
jgi:hypothetical protein